MRPPGEILNEEFLKPLGLPANALANAIGVL
jgi:plasmid maintenance system antidote protein VapI